MKKITEKQMEYFTELMVKNGIDTNSMTWSKLEAIAKTAEQTALEFSKWKDENYILHADDTGYFKFIDYINNEIKEFKTLDQLFNEWNNLK